MTFFTLINCFRKLLEFFCGVTFGHKVKYSLVVVARKMLPKKLKK